MSHVLECAQECEVTLECLNGVEGLKVRLRGDGYGREVVLESYDLMQLTPDVATVKVKLPAAAALGPCAVELCVDGENWLKSAAATSTFHVFGILQPEPMFKNVFAGGGSVNALEDGEMFAGAFVAAPLSFLLPLSPSCYLLSFFLPPLSLSIHTHLFSVSVASVCVRMAGIDACCGRHRCLLRQA